MCVWQLICGCESLLFPLRESLWFGRRVHFNSVNIFALMSPNPSVLIVNFFYMFVRRVSLQCFIRLVWIHLFGNTAVCFLRAQPHSRMHINQESWKCGRGGLLNNQDVEGFRLPPWSSSSSFLKKLVLIYFHQPVHVPVVSQPGWRERAAPHTQTHTHRRCHLHPVTPAGLWSGSKSKKGVDMVGVGGVRWGRGIWVEKGG